MKYIRTHSEENPSKVSNITFVILPFFVKITFEILSTLESTSLYETIKMFIKMVHSNPKNAKAHVHQSHVCYLHTTQFSILNPMK